MRRVAPDRPGRAASQNSWLALYSKPASGSLATTTDQTIQMANASSRLGMEIHRLRVAMRFPVSAQNAGSSGCHSRSTKLLGVDSSGRSRDSRCSAHSTRSAMRIA
ncbi:hypothetical protein D9M73_184640 [compost metagenome]